jgi:hypothetical protein
MQKMHKKTITKDDGRLLTFYTFGDEPVASVVPSTNDKTVKPAANNQP